MIARLFFRNTRYTLLACLLLVVFCAIPTTTKAQFTAETVVDFVISPEFPKPGDAVLISAHSTAIDINQALISWQINGKVTKEGSGVTTVSVNAPSLDIPLTVTVTITSPQIGTIKRSIIIRSTDMDLLWQVRSYTPPFYRGKALASPESLITLTALPTIIIDGKLKRTTDLIYTWKRNEQVEGQWSGKGKNTYQFKGAMLSDDMPKIEVQALDPESGAAASKILNIQLINPSIVYYEANPLLGLMTHLGLINGLTLKKDEVTLFATPFFFEGNPIESSNLSYEWKLNNVAVNSQNNERNLITLRRPTTPGSSLISLSIVNTRKLFESAATALTISYGK